MRARAPQLLVWCCVAACVPQGFEPPPNPVEAGAFDAGSFDAGSADAGNPGDAGSAADAGGLDCGRMQAALRTALVTHGLVGAVASVRVGADRCTAAAGFARLDTGEAMTTSHLVHIGSITKSFVTVVALQLVAEGRLSLDDPLSRWAPSYPNASAITVRELLGHTAGAFAYTDSPAFRTALLHDPLRRWAPGELVAYAAAEPAYFEPGQGFHYSNTSHVLVGMIIESVTGHPLATELRDRIFVPLGLRSTFLTDSEPVTAQPVSAGYTHSLMPDGGLDLSQGQPAREAPPLNWTYAWAAGALISSIDDVRTFNHALISGTLVPAAQRVDMMTPSAQSQGTYGLGLIVQATAAGKGYGHGGQTAGWLTFTLEIPSADATVSVSLNDDQSVDALYAVFGAVGDSLVPTP